MSKPLGKTGKRLLIALLIVVLMGGCFGAVALYARNEINKPRFHMPEIAPLPSVTALPTEKGIIARRLARREPHHRKKQHRVSHKTD